MRTRWIGFLGIAAVVLAGNIAVQTPAMHAEPVTAISSDSVLPDAPQVQGAGATGATPVPVQGGSTGTTVAMADTNGSKAHGYHRREIASKYTFYVPDDQKSVPLTNADKVRLFGVEEVGGFTFTTALMAAGWEQVINGNPKYGTDRGAFGERLGAAYIRQSSQAFFQEVVGDTLMHDDPRYYIMGRNHSFVHRFAYAATRVLTTRGDEGGQHPNVPLVLGYLGASALTQAYYPPSSRGASTVFGGWGLSLGAAALGFEFHEFLGDGLRLVHLQKN